MSALRSGGFAKMRPHVLNTARVKMVVKLGGER
jgi:hypothetical protein